MNCQKERLWLDYKTSSNYVKHFAKINGDPDVIQIRQTFNDVDKARKYESSVIRRMKMPENPKWLNRTDNISISVEDALKGSKVPRKPVSEETRRKISLSKIGMKQTTEANLKRSLTLKNRKFTNEHRNKLRESALGNKNSKGWAFNKKVAAAKLLLSHITY